MFPATYNKIIKIQPNTKTVKFRCCLSAIQMIKKYSRILDLRSIFFIRRKIFGEHVQSRLNLMKATGK